MGGDGVPLSPPEPPEPDVGGGVPDPLPPPPGMLGGIYALRLTIN